MPRKNKPLTVSPGAISRVLGAQEVEEFFARWLSAYGMNRHGVNSKAFIWHIFSAERYPALRGAEAVKAYEEAHAPEDVVLSNLRDMGFETLVRPTECSLMDFLVVPRNLAWTMAFTHEDGWLGPYFARHEAFAVLEQENERRLQKMAEAEVARSRGWA